MLERMELEQERMVLVHTRLVLEQQRMVMGLDNLRTFWLVVFCLIKLAKIELYLDFFSF